MKIVYCCPQLFHPGGMERIISMKANYLADVYGYEVFIITEKQFGNRPFYKLSDKIKHIDLGLDYDGLAKTSLLKSVINRIILKKRQKRFLKNVLEDIKADIVISTFFSEASILPSIQDGSKKILEIHFCRGVKMMYAKAFHFSVVKKCLYYIQQSIDEHIIVPKYDCFVTLTEEDKQRWRTIIPNVVAIPNILTFNNIGIVGLEAKQIIAVGRLDAQKGFDRLINIWAKVCCRFDWNLKIVGAGFEHDKLQDLIKTKNMEAYITLKPPTQFIYEEFCSSSIFVMTSRYEGLPMVMLEAMSCGLPCITYDFKCGPRDIISNGHNGFICKEDDEQDFANKLSLLMTNKELRLKMGLNAHASVQKYKADIIMPKWKKLFEEIIEK